MTRAVVRGGDEPGRWAHERAMLAKVADLIDANGEAIADDWLSQLERRGNRLVSQDNRKQLLNDAVKWITALLRSLREGDFAPMFRTSPLTAQRLALSGFPASDAVETFVVFKYVLWRLLRKAAKRGDLKLAPTVQRLEVFFDEIINGVLEEYERTWQPQPAEAAVVLRAKHLSMRAEEEAILSRLTQQMAGERDLDRLLDVIVTSAANLVGARKGFAALNHGGSRPQRYAGCRLSLPRLERWARAHPDALAALLAPEGESRLTADLGADPAPGVSVLGETLHVRSALSVPIRSGRDTIGFIALFDKVGEESWSDRDAALVADVAARGGEAIEQAAARREVEERAEQLGLLNEIGRALSWQLSPTNLVNLAATEAANLLRATSSIVWLADDGRRFKPSAVHNLKLPQPDLVFTRGTGALGAALAAADPFVAAVAEDDVEPLASLGVRAAVLVPLRRGKQTIGLLTVHDKEDGAFTESDLQLAGALENQLSIALQNAELYQQSKRLARKLHSSIASLGSALSAALDLDDLLQLIADHGLELTNARACTVLFSEDQRLERRAAAFAQGQGAVELDEDLERHAARQAMEAVEPQLFSMSGDTLSEAHKAALRAAGARGCLALPLVIMGPPAGPMVVWAGRARGVSADERDLLESFSRQAAVGIENVMLFETIQKRVVELMDLSWVSEQMIATLDEPVVIETLVRGIARALDREIAGIALLETDSVLRIPERGYLGPREIVEARVEFAGKTCISGRVMTESRFCAVDDADDPAASPHPLMEAVGARSLACAPLTGRQGTFGLVFVGDATARPIRSHEEALLGAYAGQAALALENAKHYRDVVRRAKELETLLDVTRSLSSTLELDETLHNVLAAAAALLQAPICSILLLDEQTGELTAEAAYGIEREHLLHAPLRVGNGIAGTVARTGIPIASRDLARDGRFKAREAARQEGLASLLAVPLISKGRTLGVLDIYSREPRDFTPQEQALAFSLGSEACVAIENARLYRDARQQAQSMRTLMEEVNHRIKNNLQTIVGLMQMSMGERADPATRVALQEIVARIQAIAVVHELLLESDVTAVDARDASQRIFDNARQTMARADLKVRGQIAGARVQLNSRKATALASAINELICNAIKHGFAGRREGKIHVSLQEGGGRVLVQVRDDGVGLAEGFDPARDAGLGLRIVQGIVEQDLGGEFTVSGAAGTTARIVFTK